MTHRQVPAQDPGVGDHCRCCLLYVCVCVCSGGVEEPVKQISSKDGVFYYQYHPSSPGKYTVSISWGGGHIPKR